MRVETFSPQHLKGIDAQPAQRQELESQPYDGGERRNAWTVFAGESVICSAGLMELWPGRAYAWALLSVYAGPHMLGLTRIGRSKIAAAGFRRVEMYVDSEFEAGHRFARLLGFVCETPKGMRNYLPGGRLAHLYARIQ